METASVATKWEKRRKMQWHENGEAEEQRLIAIKSTLIHLHSYCHNMIGIVFVCLWCVFFKRCRKQCKFCMFVGLFVCLIACMYVCLFVCLFLRNFVLMTANNFAAEGQMKETHTIIPV